jgi:hypothetical protein
VIVLVILLVSIGFYFFWPHGCSPHSLTQAVECLKKDGTLPAKVVALPAPESGTLLGYRVMRGDVERSASCYGGTRTQDTTSLSQLEVHYDNKQSLQQDLHALNSSVNVGMQDAGDVRLVLTNLTISKTTGVFDPLSACQAGVHDVVVWELRAGEASLVGSAEAVQNLTAHADAGPVALDSKVVRTEKEAFKVIAKDIVFAYLTQKLKTEQSAEQTTWTSEVRPDDAVHIPNVASFQHGLALKVVSFDRRPGGTFKFGLTGRQAMTATCSAGATGPLLELSMGIGDSCHVTINDATQLVLQTAVTLGEVRVTTTLARTTRVEVPP